MSATDGKDANGDAEPTVDATIEVTINVIDEDEGPSLTGATSTTATENVTGAITTYTGTDPEGATTTFTIFGNSADSPSLTKVY